MAKAFENIDIRCNDDNSITVQYRPYVPPKKGKDGRMDCCAYDSGKTVTAETFDAAIEKIKGLIKGSGTSPEKVMNKFFNGEQ